MRVFRIENKQWTGPYYGARQEGGLRVVLADDHRYCPRHPYPTKRKEWVWFDYPVCAGRSYFSLMRWFRGYVDDLRELGYRVVVLDVPDDRVSDSGSQLVIDRAAATIVGVLG